MTATIKDIANRLGVSTTTVSRALNDHQDISPLMKSRVRNIAAELGYIPNTLAQRLQKKQADSIGLILPTYGPRFSDPFFTEFLAGIGDRANKLGYDLLVSTHPPGEEEMQAYRQQVQSHRVDSFILVRTRRRDAHIIYLLEAEFPFVAFGQMEVENDFPYIDEDGEYGMQVVIDHLAELGHRRIACILSPAELNFTQMRLNGVRHELDVQGIPLDEALLATGDLTQRSGYEQAVRLLNLARPPSAIVAFNDLMAIGAMSAAQERSLEVGQDISVTGLDNIPMAEDSHPPLTTVYQPTYKIGSMLTSMLVNILTEETLESRQVCLRPGLVRRQSSGPAPQLA
jgi:LacI family transcriptional regulator, galactose operon repressor